MGVTFWRPPPTGRFGCIVIDYDLPEETGLDLLGGSASTA